MRKYQQKINELGLGEKLSKNLNVLIRDFKRAEDELAGYQERIESAETEEEAAELQKEIDELTELLEESDNEIVRKLEIYHRNRDKYLETTEKMRAKQNEKRISEGKEPLYQNKPNEPAPAPAPAPVSAEPAATTVISKSGGGETVVATPAQAVVIEEKKEEKDGFFTTIVLGALGIAGILIGVNLYKNRN